MVYAWKLPGIVPVDAQTAGDELSRIYKRDGGISLKTVVDESRGKDAPLHGCFEWDDTKAAEKYRQSQAAHIIRSITVVTEIAADNGSPMAVRAFVTTKTTPNYEPIQAVISSPISTGFCWSRQRGICRALSKSTVFFLIILRCTW